MHPAIIIGTVRSLWNWLWGRYHVPQNVFLVDQSINQSVHTLGRETEKKDTKRRRDRHE